MLELRREASVPRTMVADRVKQILSYYSSENVGVKSNLARMMNHGVLKGTGKLAKAKGTLKFTGTYSHDDGSFTVKFSGSLTQ